MLLFPFFSATQLLLTLDDQLNIVTTAVPSQSVFAVSCCFHAFLTSAFAAAHKYLPCYCYGQITNVFRKGSCNSSRGRVLFFLSFQREKKKGRSRKVYILSMLQKCALRTLLSLAELDYKVERRKKDSLCPACFTTANAHKKEDRTAPKNGPRPILKKTDFCFNFMVRP